MMNDRLDISALSDDACDNLIQIFMKARPNLAVELVALTNEEPDPDPACGRFRGCVKNWWPCNPKELILALQEKGYGFLECEHTFAVYGCDIYINRLAIGLFQKGDDVHFSVELNKEGKPQGKNLLPVSVEAKKRQLLAATDPNFDLEAYLVRNRLGPYSAKALEEREKNESSRRGNKSGNGFGKGGGGFQGGYHGGRGPPGGYHTPQGYGPESYWGPWPGGMGGRGGPYGNGAGSHGGASHNHLSMSRGGTLSISGPPGHHAGHPGGGGLPFGTLASDAHGALRGAGSGGGGAILQGGGSVGGGGSNLFRAGQIGRGLLGVGADSWKVSPFDLDEVLPPPR